MHFTVKAHSHETTVAVPQSGCAVRNHTVRPVFVQRLFVQGVFVQSYQVRIGRKSQDEKMLDENELVEKQVYRHTVMNLLLICHTKMSLLLMCHTVMNIFLICLTMGLIVMCLTVLFRLTKFCDLDFFLDDQLPLESLLISVYNWTCTLINLS